ncbi:protein WVD2-like 7 isoform X2 [Setaria italica]|uniref:protein WVD2-like 7 isoform X2 n=1 Tax=Setaria italica TaxID=4555 RepID=UPI000646E068|nr:protein WVD2-like 7 isoform X2 [Setaria italica]
MGAEPDFSPPPPLPELEPTHSPEPEIPGHDSRNWKADMMSALGESVSFGRFLTEPLEWGKWSAFAHNRYLEEAAVQARPGSVAQKKAFFEEHYARKKKRKSEDHGAAASADDDGGLEAAEEEDGGSAALWPSSLSAESSCMTDQAPAPGDEETCGGEETGVVNCCSPRASDEPVGVAEELAAVTDAVSPSCRMDAPVDELCHGEGGNEQVAGAVLELLEKKDLCSSNLVSVDAGDKQPLKESSIINQDITDSAKKRRLQMSSLLQKPTKFRSPPSGKKGQSSSVKRRSPLHSAKENTSPPGSSNLGITIAERISQLESASRTVATTQLEQFGPPRKTFSPILPEIALGASQVDGQRSSHVMRIKEKLFGSASPPVHQKTGITREKERKFKNETEFKESRQSCCFRARPLPNFYRRNKQGKDTSQQTAQEFPKFRDSNYSQTDDSHAHQMSKGVPKERQICCFPIRKLY